MRRDDVEYMTHSQFKCGFPRAVVEEFAERVRKWAYPDRGKNLNEAVAELGGRIHFENPFTYDDDTIYVHGPEDFDVVLSTLTSPRRDRFTLAHELGHYCLHSRFGEIPIVANRRGSNRPEWEANWFAAVFLMPAAEFRQLLRDGRPLYEIASRFLVSEQAAEIRRKTLAE